MTSSTTSTSATSIAPSTPDAGEPASTAPVSSCAERVENIPCPATGHDHLLRRAPIDPPFWYCGPGFGFDDQEVTGS